jgi:hypothetical protein
MELTTASISEASGVAKKSGLASQRVGRYPPKRWGGADWSGVCGDTNPPDDDHWIYRLFEELKPDLHKIFHQPGALRYDTSTDGFYLPNPLAENVQNHQLGYDYWLRQVPGKTRDWCKVYLQGLYGTVAKGSPFIRSGTTAFTSGR